MNLVRNVLAILLPPVSVLDRGLSRIVIVTALTLLGWIPGVVAALVIVNGPKE